MSTPDLIDCTHVDERGSTVTQASDDRYECIVCGEQFKLVSTRAVAPRVAPSPALIREALAEAARAYLDAEAQPAYSWVIESREARREGRPNREVERMERIARARVALGEALSALPPPTGLDVERLARVVMNDLLWTTTVIQRIAYPGSIAALFERTGLRPLVAEYETMVSNFDAYRAALSETPAPTTHEDPA